MLLPGGKKAASDEVLKRTLTDFLQGYQALPKPAKPDILANRYRIELGTPLPELNSSTGRAFAVTDLTDDKAKLYALLCAPGSVQRHRAIKLATGFEHPNVISLRASGAVLLSQGGTEQFALVYTRPEGKKLSDLIASLNDTIGDKFISKNILSPLADAIEALSALGITHGSIRADNIYYGAYPMLGDFLSEPCGFSQPFYYEPLERIQCAASARGDGDASNDYYALAVLAVILLYGTQHLSAYTPDTLVRRILRESPYAALLRGKEPPELLSDFLRGMFSPNIHERWNHKNLRQWAEGKRSNIMLPAVMPESQRPLEINGNQAFTRREAAHMLSLNWQQSLDFLRTESLSQWATLGLRDKDLAELFKRTRKQAQETTVKTELQLSEQLLRLLVLLDPNGPIRLDTLTFHFDGLDAYCAELYEKQSTPQLRLIAKFIEHSMTSYWLDEQRSKPDYVMPEPMNDISVKLDRMRLFIRNTGLGFGMERLLYELNPDMPCRSPMLTGSHVTTLPQLLAELDRVAPKYFKEQDPLDLHIAAFIAHRTGTVHDVKLQELIPHPSLATHKSLMALRFMSMAQARCGTQQFPALSQWLAYRILPALDIIKSRSLRAHIKNFMVDRAAQGYTQNLAELLIHSNYAISDVSGFNRAKETYQYNVKRIAQYQSEPMVELASQRLGHSIAAFFSYFAFAVVAYRTWMM